VGEGHTNRQLFKYGAFTGAAATVGPMLPAMTTAAHAHGLPLVLPASRPIPGGIELPDGTVIHVLAPGPPDITLPFTGIQLMGRDVEPSVITDYRGVTALAFHVGTATGSDGRRYNLETKDVCVLDSFQFGGPVTVPASVSFKIRWEATGRRERRGRGFAQLGPERNGTFLS
jgi:hypothetical protein